MNPYKHNHIAGISLSFLGDSCPACNWDAGKIQCLACQLRERNPANYPYQKLCDDCLKEAIKIARVIRAAEHKFGQWFHYSHGHILEHGKWAVEHGGLGKPALPQATGECIWCRVVLSEDEQEVTNQTGIPACFRCAPYASTTG